MITRRAILLSAFAALAAGGCSVPAPAPAPPELTFQHLADIPLGVKRVEVVEGYRPPMKTPNVEHEFPTPPAHAAGRWARDRLVALGGEDTARLVIRQASVVETPLKRSTGVKGYFTREQSERYDATLDAALEIHAGGPPMATARVKVTRAQTVPEDATLAERERIWFDMVEAMMKDFDARMDANIRKYLVTWLR